MNNYTKLEIDRLFKWQILINDAYMNAIKGNTARLEKVENSLKNVYDEIDGMDHMNLTGLNINTGTTKKRFDA